MYTFSDSRIDLPTADLSVVWWVYYLKANSDPDTSLTANEFKDDGACFAFNEVGLSYTDGDVMNWVEGMCGFKFEITNLDNANENRFNVLKDGAKMQLVGYFLMVLTAVLVAF